MFTVAVVLGAGASEVFTLPLDCAVRPESGSCAACVPDDCPAGAPSCANAGAVKINNVAANDSAPLHLLPINFEKNRVFDFPYM